MKNFKEIFPEAAIIETIKKKEFDNTWIGRRKKRMQTIREKEEYLKRRQVL